MNKENKHLLSTQANTKRLLESIAQDRAGKNLEEIQSNSSKKQLVSKKKK